MSRNMSDAGGTDNPAFSNADELTSTSRENSRTESLQQEQKDKASPSSNGRTFVSQHYVEPDRHSPDPQYKTETRIQVPAEEEKAMNVIKANGTNGLHGNGNNNDASFFNTSATSVQTNDGKKEQIEAVNLELVSMRPYTGNGNGQTKGEEACELPNDPYEEYFVPVNEHRKYISSSPNAEIETTVAGVRFDLGPGVGREGLSLRDPAAGLVDYSHWLKALRGEKLYVTKDKRSKNSVWRRLACWTFGLTILGLALVIVILAATGQLLAQEATQPLENDQQRSLDGVMTSGSQEFIKNPPPSPSPETSSYPTWPTTDESILKTVPEALEGSIWLDNLPWNDDLMDTKSRIYRDVAAEIEENLKEMLHPVATIATVKVYNISSNGEVMFRISYPPTPTPEMLQGSIEKMLRQNGYMIGKYHLSRLNVKRLIDECQYDNFHCAESCKFNYINGSFVCACFPGRLFDASGLNCVDENDLSNVSMEVEPRTTTVKDIVQGRSRAPDHVFEPRGHDDWIIHHTHHDRGEFITEPNHMIEPKTEPELQQLPEPSAEPEPEPELTSENFPESEPTFEPLPEHSTEPKFEPEPTSEPLPETWVESVSQAEPSSEPTVEPNTETKSQPELLSFTEIPETYNLTTTKRDSVIPMTSPGSDMKSSTLQSATSTTVVETTEELPTTTEILATTITETNVMHLEHHDNNEYEGRSHVVSDIESELDELSTTMTPEHEWPTLLDEITTISLETTDSPTTFITRMQDSIESRESDVVTDSALPNITENIAINVESLGSVDSSTLPTLEESHGKIPQLTPERIDPYVLIRSALGIVLTTNNGTFLESSLPNPQNTTIKPIQVSTIDEKHADDMSPFLPDVVREKELSKKSPRLDKDEHDFPNPFEPHVEDVIVHHHQVKSDTTMTPTHNANGTEFTDVANRERQSHGIQQTGTTREEDVSMVDTLTTVTSTPSNLQGDSPSVTMAPVVDIEDLEQVPRIDGIGQLGNDTAVEHDNNLNDNRANDDFQDGTNSTIKILNESQPSTTIRTTQVFTESMTVDDKISGTRLKNKLEQNEDLYNDIIDENISKQSENNHQNLADVKSDEEIFMTTVELTTIEDIETTTRSMIETERKLTIPEITSSIKQTEDNKFTTEIPIMPIEIQQDISTTEVTGRTESTMITETVEPVTNSPMITTQLPMLETKTTAQIPILPEEFSTTEDSVTEKSLSTHNTTPDILSSTIETMEMLELTTSADVKPVTEMIIDYPTPKQFDHTRFFTTTEHITTIQANQDVSSEELKVIPLEANVSEEMESTVSTELPSTVMDSSTESTIPRLKIIEITSASRKPSMNNTLINSELSTSRLKSTPAIIPVHEQVEDNIENPMLIPSKIMKNIQELLTTTSRANDEMKQKMSDTASMNFTNESMNFMFSKCNAGQFQCINGTSRDGAYCVDLSSKCDSENDCSDGSDEANCEDDGCPGNFQCKSRQCLGRHLVCNGIVDCDDGSDEDKCNEWSCHFDEFKCSPEGRCIPDLWRCNGRPDCEDHRDEYSCSVSCGNDEYLCPTEKWCIPQTWRCNGVAECANGEDENLCDCGLDQFKCQTGGCVTSSRVCDGVEDCPDRSDEWNCLIGNMTIDKSESKDGEERPIPVGQPTLLKIKQSPDNNRHLICSDGWTNNHSDAYCRSLGYFGSETTQTVANDIKHQRLLKLKEDRREDDLNIIANLVATDSCSSGHVVKVSCQEFSCGLLHNEGPTARLVGGTPAGEGQWSSVALLKEIKSGVACTASVLGPMHALASYSCIHQNRQSNNWELFTGRDLAKATTVKNVIPYPQVKYKQFLYDNDIALIELVEPLAFSRNVSAVCLPSQQFQPRALCVTAGWDFPTNRDVNLKLKFLPIPIYDTNECNATSHYAGFITKNNICAGFTGTDKGTCYNDEGAPLMCATESGRWEIQGLLSYHSRCSRGHPAIYSSLNPAISWLRNLIPALQNRT